jgi:transposase
VDKCRPGDRPSYEELEKKYNECGKNMTKLAKMYGVSDNAVNKWIKAYEKETGKVSFKRKGKPKFTGKKPLLEQLLNDLNVLKLSYTEMAKKYNVDRSTVVKWIKT